MEAGASITAFPGRTWERGIQNPKFFSDAVAFADYPMTAEETG
jgi:hypothetical protein